MECRRNIFWDSFCVLFMLIVNLSGGLRNCKIKSTQTKLQSNHEHWSGNHVDHTLGIIILITGKVMIKTVNHKCLCITLDSKVIFGEYILCKTNSKIQILWDCVWTCFNSTNKDTVLLVYLACKVTLISISVIILGTRYPERHGQIAEDLKVMYL